MSDATAYCVEPQTGMRTPAKWLSLIVYPPVKVAPNRWTDGQGRATQ